MILGAALPKGPAGLIGLTKVGRMIKLRNVAILSTVAVLASVVAPLTIATSAQAQANCETYGRLALKQMQDNEQKKCGFKGLEWSTDLKAHVTWCGSVGPDQWKVQLQKREQALAACPKKS